MVENTQGQLSANLSDSDIEVAYILGSKSSHQQIAMLTVARVTQKYDIKTFAGVTPLPGNFQKWMTEHNEPSETQSALRDAALCQTSKSSD